MSDFLKFKEQKKVKCILHTHELEQMFISLNEKQIDNMIRIPDLVLSCSITASKVMKVLGREEKIEVFYPYLNFNNIENSLKNNTSLRKKYKIPENSFIWAMSGTLDINKNPIRFINIAKKINEFMPNTYFLWIGETNITGYDIYAQRLAAFLGINNNIVWTGALEEDYYEHLMLCNGFILTSSIESFSIVVLESIFLKKPVVSFNCLGVQELLFSDIGFIVNNFDENEFASKMMSIMLGTAKLDMLKGQKFALEFDINKNIAKLEKFLEKL
jgi:glycosyltransferase involved in cell wall biosynthesis